MQITDADIVQRFDRLNIYSGFKNAFWATKDGTGLAEGMVREFTDGDLGALAEVGEY